MIDNLEKIRLDEQPKEEVVGLTQTGAEVVKPIEPPKTSLDLGQYYNDRIPTEMVTSWESNAEQQSGLKFQENVVKAKGSMLRTRQEMEQAGVEGQTQLALGQYMREQSAEKAGWTGGYMLDQARQGEYLKSTIQAQLYGQQELQKYGMESQLEAARLAYDLGKEQLALQYYNEAYQKALTEAQLFGYYVAPETRDMFNQYQAALTALAANPGDERALDVKTKVEDFYKNGQQLTEADIRKFSTATFEMNQYMEAKLEAALTLIDEDPSKFIVKDNNGNYAVDANNRYVMLDFDDVNSDDLMTFLRSDNEAGSKTSDYAVKSYMRYLGQRTINGYFSTLKEDEEPTSEGFLSWAESNPSLVNEWFRNTIAEGNKNEFFTQVGEKFTANLTGPNGSISVTFDLKNNKVLASGGAIDGSGSGGGGSGGSGSAVVFNPEWYSSNGFTDFDQHVSNRNYNNIQEFTYKNTEGNEVTRYVFKGEVLDENELAVIQGANSFTYALKFTDWSGKNDQYWNDVSWPDAYDLAGANKNFKMYINKGDGNTEELEFELGVAVETYFGLVGIGLDNSDMTYRTIGADGKTITTISYDNLKNTMKVGELKPMEVSWGGTTRKYFLTKDKNNVVRVVEVPAGGRENMRKLLGYFGITNTGFQFT
jgi:hypothetical protein